MSKAADLRAEFRAHLIDATHHVPKETVEELLRALDVVINAAVEEAQGPAVRGDVFEQLKAALGTHRLVGGTRDFVLELSKRGVVVLGKADYDALVRGQR